MTSETIWRTIGFQILWFSIIRAVHGCFLEDEHTTDIAKINKTNSRTPDILLDSDRLSCFISSASMPRKYPIKDQHAAKRLKNNTTWERKYSQISFARGQNLILKPDPLYNDFRQHLRSLVFKSTCCSYMQRRRHGFSSGGFGAMTSKPTYLPRHFVSPRF